MTSGVTRLSVFFVPSFFRRSASRTCSPLRLTCTSLLEPEVEDGRQTFLLARRRETQIIGKENRMSKPLWGGSAAAVVLLSASLLLYARPSVAETLAVTAS